MCGIYGFTRLGKSPIESQMMLDRMGELLTHRGPDGTGSFIDDQIAIGHRRLSIIDLKTGSQPMQDWQGRYVVSFNGEIYNFQELRAIFEKGGFRFKTKSDTEVILAAYAAHEERCVEFFQGMFGLAIWDKQKQKLVLARDRVGKKPLYYYHSDDRLIFASEMKAILAFPEVSRELDMEALNFYLTYGFIPAPLTIFKGIRKIKEACAAVFQHNTLTERAYWRLPDPGVTGSSCENDCIMDLESLLSDAVKSRMISDVPLGAFLSGGIDSSAVVAMMARLSSQVNTFTIDFAEKTFSELEDAQSVSAHCGTNHEVLQVSTDAVRVLPKIVWHFDEPFADSSAIPTYYVSKMAREHVTVILSGDGGDELFAGYNNYMHRDDYRGLLFLPSGLRRRLFGPVANALPVEAPMRNFFKYVAFASEQDGPGSLGIYPYIKEDIISRSLLSEFKQSDPLQFRHEILKSFDDLDKLTRMQVIDTKLYLPGDILVKVDRMSMANSLESRAPLLDYRMVEFATKLPVSLKMNEGVSKYILKQVLKKYVPQHIIAKSKQGFAVPIGEWFKTSINGYVKDVLLDSRAKNRGLFRSHMVERVLNHHSKGQRDYAGWIYTLLMLELWFQIFIDDSTRRV